MFLKGATEREAYENEARLRYELEPEILAFGKFKEAAGKRVLEIGVGLESDNQEFAKAGATVFGIDLTERAIRHTSKRLGLFGLSSRLLVSDAEDLCFRDNSFDIVYSWGVIHHSPDTPKAVREIQRVLRPGGVARIMIYHKHSFVGYMLWVRYALLRGHPFTSLDEIYSKYLESSGTKAYTVTEAIELFSPLRDVTIATGSHARRPTVVRGWATTFGPPPLGGKAGLPTATDKKSRAQARSVHVDRGAKIGGPCAQLSIIPHECQPS